MNKSFSRSKFQFCYYESSKKLQMPKIINMKCISNSVYIVVNMCRHWGLGIGSLNHN